MLPFDRKKLFGAAIAILFTGIFIGVAINEPKQTSPEFKKFIQSLSKIYQVDYDEYFLLQKEENKCQKAEKILGKMLLMGLIELKLKLNPQYANKARAMIEGFKRIPSSENLNVHKTTKHKPLSNKIPSQNRSIISRRLASLKSNTTSDELEKFKLPHNHLEKGSAFVETIQFYLSGPFEGGILFNQEDPRKGWRLQISTEPTKEYGTFLFSIKLLINDIVVAVFQDTGKKFYAQSSLPKPHTPDTIVNRFRLASPSHETDYIFPLGSRYYLQIVSQNIDTLLGNFYILSKQGALTHKGIFELNRIERDPSNTY